MRIALSRFGCTSTVGISARWTIVRAMRSSALAFFVAGSLAGCGSSSISATPTDAGTSAENEAGTLGDANALPVPLPDAGPTMRVRLMAANLTSGTDQSYDDPGIRIFQGLAPDVVMIQEFKYAGSGAGADGGTDLRALVDTAFGPSFSFYVDPRTGGIPNGIVSRYPILTSGVWTDASVPDRAFSYAQIDVPGPVDLWAVSVHLLTTGATERATEATQLLGYLQASVPAGDYLVVAGDFNTDVTTEQALTTLSAAVVVAPPYPADQSGNTDSSINRNYPHDWVLAGPSLDARKTAVTIGATTLPDGLVFDSRVYTPLTDVAPILATDSAATGMQHMPVVRDFLFDAD
jgi:endonuclease/exonuclease/phosphatase family metal-dependent hydrolase